MRENLGLEFWDVSEVFVLTDDEGVVHDDPILNFFGCSIISPTISDEKLERLLSYWDYGCTDAGYKRINLGIKGVDWDEEDGKVVSHLVETGELLVNKYQGVYPIVNGSFIISNDFEFIDPAITDKSKEEFSEQFIVRSDRYKSKGSDPDWDLLSYSSQALNVASFNYAEEYSHLISLAGEFDSNYENWINEKAGVINAALDDLNTNLAK